MDVVGVASNADFLTRDYPNGCFCVRGKRFPVQCDRDLFQLLIYPNLAPAALVA